MKLTFDVKNLKNYVKTKHILAFSLLLVTENW